MKKNDIDLSGKSAENKNEIKTPWYSTYNTGEDFSNKCKEEVSIDPENIFKIKAEYGNNETLNENSFIGDVAGDDLDIPGSETILTESAKFEEWDMNSLIDVIKRYHLETKENITDIYNLAQKVSVKHSYKHPELSKLTASLFLFFHDLLFHIKKKEKVLIPNILQLFRKTVPAATSTFTTFGLITESALVMQNEHQVALKELEFFRQLTNNYLIPEDACSSYKQLFKKMKEFEKDLMLLIHLEKNILFPKAIQMDKKFTEKKEIKT